MDCELCGKGDSKRNAIVDGIRMIVCDRCVKMGKEVRPVVKTSGEKVATRPVVEKEEIVVSDFSKKIRKARRELGIEQKELAERIAEKKSVIGKVESGSMRPTLALAKKLEKSLNISLIEESEPIDFESENDSGEVTLGDILKLK